MNIVYLIGNGFDLNFGLKTSYRDFYEYYQNARIVNLTRRYKDAVTRFKTELTEQRFTQWSDLEKGLGEYTDIFSPGDNDVFIEILNHVATELVIYLRKINNHICGCAISNTKANQIKKNMLLPWNFLNEKNQEKANKMFNFSDEMKFNYKIITFNYTHTLERILNVGNLGNDELLMSIAGKEYFLRSITHIHGDVNTSVILGVNDARQIVNMDFRKNEALVNRLVKNKANNITYTQRPKICREAIMNADVICMIGLSFGETDKRWYKQIITRMLNQNVILIIFTHQDATNPKIIRTLKNKMLQYLDGRFRNMIDNITDRIFIASLNSFFNRCKTIFVN